MWDYKFKIINADGVPLAYATSRRMAWEMCAAYPYAEVTPIEEDDWSELFWTTVEQLTGTMKGDENASIP